MPQHLHSLLSKLEKLEEQKVRFRTKIDNLKNELQEVLQENERFQKKLQQREEQKRKIDLDIRRLELQVKEEEEKIRKWEGQLREITKYREQKVLMDEIAEAKKEKSKIEDQLLDLIFARDELENEIRKMKEESEKKIEEYRQRTEEIQGELTNAEQEYSETINKIQNLIKDFEANFPEVFSYYLEISNDKRTKKTIARVEKSTCTSCYVVLSPEIEVRLYTNSSYEICPNCGAILYVDLEDET